MDLHLPCGFSDIKELSNMKFDRDLDLEVQQALANKANEKINTEEKFSFLVSR